MAAPPDLRVLCRRLASTPVDDLPRLSPLLVGHALRCGAPLSAAVDATDKSSETPMLVHKLRTHITTLLTGKNPSGRFAAVCLVKAVIDVGGWESLRASDAWIRGLIGVLQKPDPLASKELCIAALTKIYMLLQGYQTLTREMATPTLPSYVTACLQLIKPPASGRPLRVPAAFIDTVACSLSKLVILYPTTLRPFTSQIRAALRCFIAPTSSDALVVPQSLRDSSRRLLILLSYTAPKNGSSDEWGQAIRSSLLDCHATIDEIFRAVRESWESTTGYQSKPAGTGPDPSGGGDSAEDLPPWTGVQAGAERLIGLLEFIADYFNNPTKAPVTVPLGELLDLTGRITLVTPPSSASDDSVETNPAISRDEKAELWSVLPDIHIAVLRLHHALIRRLRESAAPLATDILDQMVRVSRAGRHIPRMREAAYILAKYLLLLAGPTLPKLTVESLAPLIQSSCQDILLATGYLNPSPQQTQPPQNGITISKHQKPNPTITNADAYLAAPSPSSPSSLPIPLSSSASSSPASTAATHLLPLFLSHLPQRHLAPELRGLLDRTAILSADKPAMLASCLHPYRDGRGRYYASILPFLVRRFPRDQEVEVLRSNLVRGGGGGGGGGEGEGGWDPREGLEELLNEGAGRENSVVGGDEEGAGEERDDGEGEGEEERVKSSGKVVSAWGVEMDVDVDTAATVNAFAAVSSHAGATAQGKQQDVARPASPLKRKSEQFEVDETKPPPKRVDTGKTVSSQQPQVAVMPTAQPAAEGDEDDSDSDDEGSVEIDMGLEDDDEDEEDEEVDK